MDRTTEDIKNELGDFSKRNSASLIFPATVLSYNSGDETVSVQLSNDAVIDDVRLRSVIKAGNKLVFVPAVNSVVQIASIENSKEFIVIAVAEISEIKTKIGNTTFDINATGFLLQKQDDTLKDALVLLIQAVQYIIVLKGRNPNRVKLQQALDKVNNLLR